MTSIDDAKKYRNRLAVKINSNRKRSSNDLLNLFLKDNSSSILESAKNDPNYELSKQIIRNNFKEQKNSKTDKVEVNNNLIEVKDKYPSLIEQQYEGFLKSIENDKEYEGIVSELLTINKDTFKKTIGDINLIKDYLKEKGINESIIVKREQEYLSYLKGNYYYGAISTYPENLQERIKENEKKLLNIKNQIISSYNGKSPSIDIEKSIKEYVSYFFIGRYSDSIFNSKMKIIPTIYTKVAFDKDIMNIIEKTYFSFASKLSDIEEKILEAFKEGRINSYFMNDCFIHESGFPILEDIIKDGYIKSANLLVNGNSNYHKVKTQTNTIHRDIYFSRGHTDGSYGRGRKVNTDRSLKNKIYVVNTVKDFASNGYGVPINIDIHGEDSASGYSIISKNTISQFPSSLSNMEMGTYIDIRDVYIFVAEGKKEETEGYLEQIKNDTRYKDKSVNIIYIPDECYETGIYRKDIFKINEYISSQIKKSKDSGDILPTDVYYSDEINACSISQRLFVFFDNKESVAAEYKEPSEIVRYIDGSGNAAEKIIQLINNIYSREDDNIEQFKIMLQNIDEENSKNLPLDFPIELIKIGLVMECMGLDKFDMTIDNRAFPFIDKMMCWLKAHGYSSKQIKILQTIMRLNRVLRDRESNKIIPQVRELVVNYGIETGFQVNTKDLFSLFIIYYKFYKKTSDFNKKDDLDMLEASTCEEQLVVARRMFFSKETVS